MTSSTSCADPANPEIIGRSTFYLGTSGQLSASPVTNDRWRYVIDRINNDWIVPDVYIAASYANAVPTATQVGASETTNGEEIYVHATGTVKSMESYS